MQASLDKFFGENVYMSQIEDFEKINNTIIPIIEKDITPTNSQFATTTDVIPKELQEIDDNLHLNKKFKSLYTQIKLHILEYLKIQKYNLKVFDVYILKSWATLSINEQYIHNHKHMASHISFVYYPRAEKQGNLKFLSNLGYDSHMYIPARNEYFEEFNEINYTSMTVPAQTGGIIIFPSKLFHETEINKTKIPRISISGDVLITMKPGIKSEHCFPSPLTWKKL